MRGVGVYAFQYWASGFGCRDWDWGLQRLGFRGSGFGEAASHVGKMDLRGPQSM